ncbi:MAG: hypothetical protein ABEJ94_08860 [Halorientalis sp.]
MRHRDDSHVDEWAALVGENVGDRERVPGASGRRERGARRYRDETGSGTDR